EKLNFSFDLLQGKNKNFLLQNLNLFQNKINDLNLQSDGNTEKMNISVQFDKNYLSYLNSYSQGLIAFGTPMPVNIDSQDANYYRAFLKKFVGNFSKEIGYKNLNRIHLTDEAFLKEIAIHSLQLSKDKISIQKVITEDILGELYELLHLLNELKKRVQFNIEPQIITDKNSTLPLEQLKSMLKDFKCVFIQTDLSTLEAGSIKSFQLENLMKEINAKQAARISTSR
ncbi:MAG: hypothetical protein AAGG68_29240, partial [Bacteroidota bacterium]